MRRTQRYTPKVADDEEALIEGLAEDTTHLTSPRLSIGQSLDLNRSYGSLILRV